MKNLLLLLAISCLFTTSLYAKEYSFTKEYNIASPADLKISTSGGNIQVTGHDQNVVEVSFIVRQRNEVLNITLNELNDYVDYEIVSNKQNLSIIIGKSKKQNISVGFDIKTPRKTSCKLVTSGGNIRTSEINGVQEIITSGGNLNLEKMAGKINAKTSGGNVNLSMIKADVDCRTSGGNMRLFDIDGQVNIATSGGEIKIETVRPSIVAKTSGGNISVSNTKSNIELYTSGGNISLSDVAGSIKAKTTGGGIKANVTSVKQLMLSTSGGNIQIEIPSGLGYDLNLKAERISTQLSNFTGTNKKNRISGSMNGGGIPVELITTGGTINLDFK